MRFRLIEDQREDWPVRVMCDALNLSPSSYDAWRSRPQSPRQIANRELPGDLQRVHARHRERYGAPRIHAELPAEGQTVSRKRVERLMRRHEIQARVPRRYRVCTTDSKHSLPVAANLLDRNFGGVHRVGHDDPQGEHFGCAGRQDHETVEAHHQVPARAAWGDANSGTMVSSSDIASPSCGAGSATLGWLEIREPGRPFDLAGGIDRAPAIFVSPCGSCRPCENPAVEDSGG